MSFKKGFKAVDKEKERRETEAVRNRGRLWRIFFPKDSDSDYIIPITFLTEEPVSFNEHVFSRAGKIVQIMCTADEHGEGCTHCSHDKPKFKSSWLVFDHRPYEVDERDAKGNKTGRKTKKKGNVKVLVRGLTDATLLEKRSNKHGLLMNTFELYKTGSGNSTVWNYDFDAESSITLKEIESSIPDELRSDEFKTKGKLDFYKILEHQILSTAEDAEDEEEAQEAYASKVKNRIIEVDEEDEAEDEPVSKAKTIKKPSTKKPIAVKPKLKR
jgi:hypothetical protein